MKYMKDIVLLGNGHAALGAFENIMKRFRVKGVILPYEDKLIESLCEYNNIQYSYDIGDLAKFEPDICLMISYGKLIPSELIVKYNFINVHYGLLPKYRGLHTVAWAIINGEKETGYTIHKIDEQIDNGDILYQKKIKIEKQDNIQTVMEELDKLLEVTICCFIEDYLNNRVDSIKQNIYEATFFGRRNLDDCLINWNDTTHNILNFIRALVPPYPGAYTQYKDKRITIVCAEEFNAEIYIEIPGRVLCIIDNIGIVVKTRDTTILIKKVIVNGEMMSADKCFSTIGIRLT